MTSSIFSVKVVGCTEIYGDRPLRNVVVKISLASTQSGELATKSKSSIGTFSQYEVSPVVPQACTKGINCAKLTTLSALWNETFVFNEDIDTLFAKDNCLFFEIIDQTIHKNKHGFNPIAWGFLHMYPDHLEKANVLQLFSYPQNFDASLKGTKLPVVGLMKERTPMKARLTVHVYRETPKEVEEVEKRPTDVFQKEISEKSLDELLEPVVEEEDVTDDTDDLDDTIVIRKCLVPRKLAAQIPAGENGILALRFNRSGTCLAAALQIDGDYCIQFYDTKTLALTDTVKAHVDLIYELAFSNDDRNILSASSDGMVKIWNAKAPHELKMTLPHSGYIYSAKFHPSKTTLVVTAGIDGIIRVWNRRTGELLKELKEHKTRVNSVVFSPNGKQLFSGDASGCIGVWDFDIEELDVDKVCMQRFVRENEIKDCCITHLAMGKSNLSLLVYTQDGIVRNFETKVMVPSQRYVGAKCSKYRMESCFSPDTSYVMAGSENGSVMLWSVRGSDPVPVIQWSMKFSHPVTSIAWNAAEDMVAFASFGAGQNILVFVTEENPRAPRRFRRQVVAKPAEEQNEEEEEKREMPEEENL